MRFRPRFSLRTLFVLVALAGVPIGWVGCQLNWIRQRHRFLEMLQQGDYGEHWVSFQREYEPAPWSLRIFGEPSAFGPILGVPESQGSTFHALFPEATWTPVPDPAGD